MQYILGLCQHRLSTADHVTYATTQRNSIAWCVFIKELVCMFCSIETGFVNTVYMT
jgi:hypothetical protein